MRRDAHHIGVVASDVGQSAACAQDAARQKQRGGAVKGEQASEDTGTTSPRRNVPLHRGSGGRVDINVLRAKLRHRSVHMSRNANTAQLELRKRSSVTPWHGARPHVECVVVHMPPANSGVQRVRRAVIAASRALTKATVQGVQERFEQNRAALGLDSAQSGHASAA